MATAAPEFLLLLRRGSVDMAGNKLTASVTSSPFPLLDTALDGPVVLGPPSNVSHHQKAGTAVSRQRLGGEGERELGLTWHYHVSNLGEEDDDVALPCQQKGTVVLTRHCHFRKGKQGADVASARADRLADVALPPEEKASRDDMPLPRQERVTVC